MPTKSYIHMHNLLLFEIYWSGGWRGAQYGNYQLPSKCAEIHVTLKKYKPSIKYTMPAKAIGHGTLKCKYRYLPKLIAINVWSHNLTSGYHLSRLMGKPTICIGENKDADQLRGNREADQRLCFHYSDSTIPLLLKSENSSF